MVPIGTVVYDTETDETLGDLTHDGDASSWPRAARAASATSISRAARTARRARRRPGYPGEKRELRLELKLIADVGLLGLPNAGKSTLISAVSAARPQIADYPFTTLHPNLGVVYVGEQQSFVMADIPGLIEGAADGAGLGIRFLKHLQRTRVLLHLVDIAPPDPDADPVKDARAIAAELKKFSPELATRERWLVLNKIDLLPPAEAEKRCKEIVRRLRWKGPVFRISGATRAGTKELCQAIMRRLGRDGCGGAASRRRRASRAAPAAAQMKKPARGRRLAGLRRGPLLGRDRLDLRVQLALVTRSLVAMDDALGDHRVDDRLGRLERRGGLVLLAGADGVEHLLDRGAQPRAGRHVVGAALDGLLGALFCGLDVRHEFGLQIEPRILAEDAREVNPRYSAAGMKSTPAARAPTATEDSA